MVTKQKQKNKPKKQKQNKNNHAKHVKQLALMYLEQHYKENDPTGYLQIYINSCNFAS